MASANAAAVAALQGKGFSEEKVAELESAFNMFDKSGTGQLVAADLKAFYSSLGARRGDA